MIEPESGRNLAQQAALEIFLESPACPENTMNFYQLDGYLRAVCAAPVLLSPDEWLPLVFNDMQPEYGNAAEAEQIVSNIMGLYNFHAQEVANNLCNLPCSAVYASLQEERIDLEQWARGFLQGYIICEESWNELLVCSVCDQDGRKTNKEDFSDELDAILYIVSTVADAKYALQEGTDLEDLDSIFGRLPDSMILYAQIGQTLYECGVMRDSLIEPGITKEQFLCEEQEISDNDPCLCGSGKKFKTCCLH